MLPIPLHVHSHWSLLDGVPSVQEIVEHARSLGLPSIALTDTNALYGAVEFAWRCHDANIHPIIGAELTLAGGGSIVLLAEDLRGYGSLCRLITLMQATPDREAALARGLAYSDLEAHTEGLIALSGGHTGPLDADLSRADQTARELIDLYGRERFFVELQIVRDADADKAQALQSLADRLGVPTVATHDIRYLSPRDASRYRVLAAMRTGQRVDELAPLPDCAFPSPEMICAQFKDFAAALDTTQRVADRCRCDLPLGQLHFPTLDLPDGLSSRDKLWTDAFKGAAQRYGALTPEVEARLQKEVHVIDTLGYTPYFLVVADIVRFARERRVPLSPRGSASSSVVAYCLGIHDVDPIAHNLYFERFLSLERHDPPDIDMDLCSHRRDEVIDYVYRRYGADHVAMVCTYATLQPRSALREVCKVYGIQEKRIKELSKHLPAFWHPGLWRRIKEAQAEVLESARDPIEREAIEMSQALTGAPHHLSIHPGGIVISPGPITDLVPLQYATKGLLITQFDLKGIEKLGLVKIDLLGISALTVVADCIELVQQRQPDFTLESIPLDDAATAQTLATAHTIGCFQIESPGMRMTVRELTARSVNDLIVALALYRPGPLTGGLKDAFVRRHLGQEAATYPHPSLEPILRETYGVILYQEQVLRIAHEIGGFTLGEADLLRRAMSKKLSGEMARMREQFVDGAHATSRMDAATAEQIWELMAAFAGYGFPKAHAAGYAFVAYRMAYLKTHYPAEFMAARLAVWGGFYSPRVYMTEARQLGLTVRPPHVSHSREEFTLDPTDRRTLWMGLGQVRDLTRATIETILAGRPFKSFEDFLLRARPLHVEVVNLVKAGALEGLGNAKDLLAVLEQDRWHGRHTAQLSLIPVTLPHTDDAPTLHERAEWEREVLGRLVSVHPLQLIKQQLPTDRIRSNELGAHSGKAITIAGVRVAAHRFRDQSGEYRLLVDMEDEAGMYQVLWSGEVLRQYQGLVSQREPVSIRGKMRIDRQGQVIVAGAEAKQVAE